MARNAVRLTSRAIVVRDKLKDKLWDLLLRELTDNDVDGLEVNIVSSLYEAAGLRSDDVEGFKDKLRRLKLFDADLVTYEIRLSPLDRRKILDDLDVQCLSQSAKDEIRRALDADEEENDDDDEDDDD